MDKAKDSSIQSKVAEFYNGIRRGEILMTTCRKCGSTYFPPRANCHKCYSSDIAWERLANPDGQILTYTKITSPPESYSGFEPYTCAIVKLEQGQKVMGWIESKDGQKLVVGSHVRVSPHEFSGGRLGVLIEVTE